VARLNQTEAPASGAGRVFPRPLTELGLAGVALLSVLVLNSLPAALVALGLAWALLIVILSDLRDFIVPDAVSLSLVLLGPPIAGWLAGPALFVEVMGVHALAAAAGGLLLWLVGWLFERVRGRSGLGLGDVKLFAAAGAWVGPAALPWTLVLACAGVLLCALPPAIRGDAGLAVRRIPFGLYLAPALWLVWMWRQAGIWQ